MADTTQKKTQTFRPLPSNWETLVLLPRGVFRRLYMARILFDRNFVDRPQYLAMVTLAHYTPRGDDNRLYNHDSRMCPPVSRVNDWLDSGGTAQTWHPDWRPTCEQVTHRVVHGRRAQTSFWRSMGGGDLQPLSLQTFDDVMNSLRRAVSEGALACPHGSNNLAECAACQRIYYPRSTNADDSPF